MATKQGQPDAQVTLGQMYENGEGVPQDYGMAANWYRKAADHTIELGGAGVAANSLVQLYQDGHTTSQDYVFVYLAYAYAQDTDGMQEVAQKMNASQLADAQRRVRAWKKRFHLVPQQRRLCQASLHPPNEWRNQAIALFDRR